MKITSLMAKLLPRRLSTQLALLFVVFTTVSMAAFTYNSAERESQRIADSMRLQAQVLSQNLAATTADQLLSRDYTSIELSLQRAVHFPGVLGIQITDAQNQLLGDVIKKPSGETELLYGREAPPASAERSQTVKVVDDKLIVTQPILLGNLLGWVTTTYSLQEVKDAKQQVWQDNILDGGLIGALTIVLVLLFLRRPMYAIATYTDFADKLDRNLGERTEVESGALELHKLASALNRVSRRLKDQDTAIHNAVADLRRLAAFPEHDPNIVISMDAAGNIQYMNPSANQLLRRSDDAVPDINAFLPKDTSELVQRCLNEDLSVQGVETVAQGRTFLWTFAPVKNQGILHCYAIEITERKKAEERAKSALVGKLSAEAASKAKSQFLATMSHEIRTPMNGVLGMTELLLGTRLSDQQRRFAENVRRSAGSLLNIINDILDFSKIEAGKLELENIDFDLRELVEELCTLFAPQAQRKGLEMLCIIAPSAPVGFSGDSNRLRQVLTNLMGNALKFTKSGEIAVVVSPEYQRGDQFVMRIEVRDTGIGISPDAQDRIFESFSQADSSTTRHFGGTGLGLAICKQLVELMGGRIGVNSAPGQGSTFWVSIPLARRTAQSLALSFPPEDAARVRVLVVDDNATSRDAIHDQLVAWKIACTVAPNAEQALDMMSAAATSGTPFTVVLVDRDMPDVGGFEFARQVDATRRLRGTRLVLLSPVDEAADVTSGDAQHFASIVIKPARQAQLFDALAHAMDAPMLVEARRPALRELAPQQAPRVKNMRVLVAEDNPVNQELTLSLLELAGCVVTLSSNGQEALDACQREHFDLVLMDCQMPGMDGYEATQAIRRFESAQGKPRVPIVALTANAVDGDREKCIASGMDDYLSKPFTRQQLGEMLSKWSQGAVMAAAPVKEVLRANPAPSPTPRNSESPLDRVALNNIRALQRPGSPNLLSKLINVYFSSSQELMASLRDGIAQADSDAVRKAAHALKSSSANLGAKQLAGLCKDLEALGRANQIERAPALYSQVESEYARVTQALEAERNSTS